MPTHIPVALTPVIFRVIADSGDRSEVTRVERAKGGVESQSWRIGTRRRSYLLKYHLRPGVMDYPREAADLALLRDAGVRVPNVLAAAPAAGELPDYCIQEWIHPGTPQMHARRLGARLGESIARLHALEQPVPGFGSGETWETDWIEHVRKRFLSIAAREETAGRLPGDRRHQIETLAERLESILGTGRRRPSLLHGDLHARNVLVDRKGENVLIDPHAFYGDREEEIAYTEMYGYFALAFYQGYRAVLPLEDGYRERRDLYCLLHLLVRLVEAGQAVTPQIDRLLHRYLGCR